MSVKLVTFDALHTLVTPRLPIYVQYSQTFEPYLGALDPTSLKSSFKSALKQVQIEKPAYKHGAEGWWSEVIRRTAVGAGANLQGKLTAASDPIQTVCGIDPRVVSLAVDASLSKIVPRLLQRFSSREGYKLFDDTLVCLLRLKELNIRTGLVSNTDARMRAVLEDLDIMKYLDPFLISEAEGVEKPSAEIYARACSRAGVNGSEVIHVGDELEADYWGAKKAGICALLIRRHGAEGEEEHKEPDEDLTGVEVVHSLQEVVDRVRSKLT
ncbi:HAD hydrolase subfamily IA REG-2-like protein [Panus rudis PR-1116 ss-1]|nr:HAD hydrolase subfamily IA REG-2-like protein [Panus rudis PR-1116 ss-1]